MSLIRSQVIFSKSKIFYLKGVRTNWGTSRSILSPNKSQLCYHGTPEIRNFGKWVGTLDEKYT